MTLTVCITDEVRLTESLGEPKPRWRRAARRYILEHVYLPEQTHLAAEHPIRGP